jgi:hypothetical protein
MLKNVIATLAIPAVVTCLSAAADTADTDHPYLGLWVTADGNIVHELLPTGRYVEARGNRERAYEGRYEVTGTHIEYWDDTGFRANGDFVSIDVLNHAGMVLYRQGSERRGSAAP